MIELNNFKNDYIVEYIHNINFNIDINNNQSLKLDYYKNNINDINIDLTQNSLELLKIEDELIFYLHKYCLKTHDIDNDFIIKMLNLILNISNILKKRVKLPDFNFKINDKNKNELKRCSYKFCKFKETCNYNYCKKKCICYQDHFVHHMVSFDILQLLNYLNSDIVNHLEILKSIKTLAFVINHMKNELSIKCLYCKPNEIEKNHIVNNDLLSSKQVKIH
ncbi:hypothetical protein [Chlorella virus XW01]|nr:hypothetical protein [Chlorella virus XW01]